jgi:adenine deaminase
MNLSQIIEIARGDAPADLALRNGKLINVYTGEIYETDIIICADLILALGPGYQVREEIDLGGRYVAPGFIDAHVHIESTMLNPYQFARAVVPRGTTSVVSDPHEIANVCGLEGIHYMMDVSAGLPLTVFINAPSCVPATHMSTAGANLDADKLTALIDHPRLIGLAEMMNFPGLILGDPEVLAKIEAFKGRIVDGHGPGVSGLWLNAYAAAGVGSDHECTTRDEATERLRLGMYIYIREGTSERNLIELLPIVTPENSRRCCFCADDRHLNDIMDHGHIDYFLSMAIDQGLDPVTAIRMATLNAAERFRLHDLGAIAPGKRADLVVFSDMNDIRPTQVYSGGRLVAQDNEPVGDWLEPTVDEMAVRNTVNVDWSTIGESTFHIKADGDQARVIGAIEGQVMTEHRIERIARDNGLAVVDVERDILKMAVIERHRNTGNVGLGFVQGFGLQKGALAGSVAHDHHNIVTIGADDQSMLTAARAVGEMGGGFVVANQVNVLAQLPLPIAGLMSDQSVKTVRDAMDTLLINSAALGSVAHDPFMTMSFMALEVIPSLKLTDQGLVNVEEFKPVPLFVED